MNVNPQVPAMLAARLQSTRLAPSGSVRELTVRTGVIDRQRQLLCQQLAELVNRDIEARRQLLGGIAAQYLLQLLRCDWQVLAVSDPGLDLIAEAGLLQLGDDGIEPALAAIAKHFAENNRQHGRLKLAERTFQDA